MQNNATTERSAAGQLAQTVKVKPKWHMTVLHIVYYLIMAAFLSIFFRSNGMGGSILDIKIAV